MELQGLAVPLPETINTDVAPGPPVIITRDANDLGKTNGVAERPVMFVVLAKVFNDPLLDTISTTYDFIKRFNRATFTYDNPQATQTIPAFFLPVKKVEITLTATATETANTTVELITDLMSDKDADLFTLAGSLDIEDLIAEVEKRAKARAADPAPETIQERIEKTVIPAKEDGKLFREHV